MSESMKIDEEKAAFNARAKASMLIFLKSKSWPEKIRSIERMKAVAKTARQAMKQARAGENSSTPKLGTRNSASHRIC
jgi:shikimate kinase